MPGIEAIWQLIAGNAYLIIDTLLVATALYYLFIYVRGTRTAVLLQAFIAVALLYFLCQYFQLITLVFILERVLLIGPIAVIIIFAPEIRQLLERASRRSRLIEWIVPEDIGEIEEHPSIEVVADAVGEMSEHSRGALIVIERTEPVDQFIVPGTRMDAMPSPRLISSIFEPSNPLHDGALLIRGERIHSAGNFLPISEATQVAEELGTRHRAALGLTERCDAVVIVISEERGEISISFNGRMARRLTMNQFVEQLRALLEPNENFASIVPRAVFI